MSVPLTFIVSSTCSHGPFNALPALSAALPTVLKNTSSIFSRLASAPFICLLLISTPWLTNCCSAARCACTACSSAASMPAKAFSSSASASTAGIMFFAAPLEAACVTDFNTLRMLATVSSRPCSALSVASLTALRSASPCCALDLANMSMSAS